MTEKKWKPDIFLSLGENCLSAFILKHFKLRENSYLFDWASCERFDICPDILNNSLEHHIFNNIINNDNINTLVQFPFGEGDRRKIIYVHHPDKEYQKRVSQRFFDVINSNKKVLFLYSYGRNNLHVSDEDFDKLINTIKINYSNLEFKLLIIHYIGEGTEFNLIKKTSLITKYEYKTTTPPPWHSNEMDKLEVFKEILSEYI